MERSSSRRAAIVLAVCLAAALGGCAAQTAVTTSTAPHYQGVASWYGQDFHGKPTSSGDRYSMYRLTAASRDIPLGSTVRVTRPDNGRSVELLVNDRGPFVEGRIIDLSYEAARRLDMLETGLATVQITVLSVPEGQTIPPPTTALAAASTASVGGGPQEPPVWWISLGAFSAERNAFWLHSRVVPDFPNAAVLAVTTAGRTIYRVDLGPYSSTENTAPDRRRLAELGLKTSVESRTVDAIP